MSETETAVLCGITWDRVKFMYGYGWRTRLAPGEVVYICPLWAGRWWWEYWREKQLIAESQCPCRSAPGAIDSWHRWYEKHKGGG